MHSASGILREGNQNLRFPSLVCILSMNLDFLNDCWKSFDNRYGKFHEQAKSRTEAGVLFWDLEISNLGFPQSGESLEPKSNFQGEEMMFWSLVCVKKNHLDKLTVFLTWLKWRCLRVYMVAELQLSEHVLWWKPWLWYLLKPLCG